MPAHKESYGIPDSDYFRYHFNKANQSLPMPVRFVPDAVFILNTTDANFYLKVGDLHIPTTDRYDLIVPPHTYYLFVPYRQTIEFAGLLNNPSFWDCYVYFKQGGATLHAPVPQPIPAQPLAAMPDPTVVADFTFVVS